MKDICPNCNIECNLAGGGIICCSCFYEKNNKTIGFLPCEPCITNLYGDYDKINYGSDNL
jgi:hypothetical protein